MLEFGKQEFLVSIILSILLGTGAPLVAQEYPPAVCNPVIHDEQTELKEAQLAVDLAKSNFAAYEKIFKMIEKLWEARTIPRMDYVKAKYDRDAAQLGLEKADLILERQAALVEQYRLICNENVSGAETRNRERAIGKAYLKYLRADCDSQAKAIEIASTNLEYNREYVEKILQLRREDFATNTQVILAELDVELEEKNLEDAKGRTAACRAELAGLENGGKEPIPTREP